MRIQNNLTQLTVVVSIGRELLCLDVNLGLWVMTVFVDVRVRRMLGVGRDSAEGRPLLLEVLRVLQRRQKSVHSALFARIYMRRGGDWVD